MSLLDLLASDTALVRCRECGCTEDHACTRDVGLPMPQVCGWVEPDLCSACAEDAGEGWQRPR
jgi:hypothetical protein